MTEGGEELELEFVNSLAVATKASMHGLFRKVTASRQRSLASCFIVQEVMLVSAYYYEAAITT